MALVSTEWTEPPEPRALYVARPALGALASALAQGVNHLQGWRFQRSVVQVIEHEDATDVLTGPYNTIQVPSSDTHYVVLPTSAEPDPDTGKVVLWLAFTYYADSSQTSTPNVVASVESFTGAVVDAGCTWSVDNGHLEDKTAQAQGRSIGGGGSSGWHNSLSVLLTAHTGWGVENKTTLTAYPRPLLAAPDATVAIKLAVQGVAVFSVSAFEMFREEI